MGNRLFNVSLTLKFAVLTAILAGTSLLFGPGLSADPPPPHRAKPQSAWSLAHLYNVISNEHPLNNNDIDSYIKELPLILALSGDPSLVPEVLAATGWTENRLVYVSTKVGLGLVLLLNPEEKGSQKYPAFASPSANEERLIAEREPEIQAAYNKIITASQKPVPKKKPAPKKAGS